MTLKVLILQIIVAFGLLNVWLIRPKKSTRFRGGSSQSLKDEFLAYGLPSWFFYLIAVLKVGAATALLAGILFPVLILPSSVLIGILMLGALAMHLKINDPPIKSLPAATILVMVIVILIEIHK
jgi:hypothetical protein